MITLSAVISSLVEQSGSYQVEAPETWAQGRTLYGGITAALCLAATQRAFSDLPPLRSTHFTFVGPASGMLNFRPAILRQGRSATIVAVDGEGDSGVSRTSDPGFRRGPSK